MGFERAASRSLASRLFRRGPGESLALLRAAWPRVVGVELARRTELVALDAGTLRVRVPDAAWRRVLHAMQPDIVARLGEVAGELAPRRLGFLEGTSPVTLSAPPAAPAPAATPCPASVEAEAGAIADPELRRGFVRAAALYLARSGRP